MNTYYQALLSYALRLLSKRRYTGHGITKKLASKKLGTAKDIENVLERLKDLKYIDDLSFAKDYIANRLLLNPRGTRMLKMELKLKGIKSEYIEKAITEASIDDFKNAISVLDRKKRSIYSLPKEKKRKKILSLLASRGFNFDTIYKIFDKW